MSYIFLDESGQFARDGSDDYFVIGSYLTSDPRRLQKSFRSFQNFKLPHVIKSQPEIKFSGVDISDALRIKIVRAIANMEVRIHYTFLNKKNIPSEYHHKGSVRDGDLYTHIVAETIKLYLPINDLELRVFCDQRHLKGISQRDFKENLRAHLLPLVPPNCLVRIEMVNSQTSPNIQIADWIAGSLSSYLNSRPIGQELFDALKNNLLMKEGKELFKDNWAHHL